MRHVLICAALLAAACKCQPVPGPGPSPAPTPTVAPTHYDAGPVGDSYTAACGHLAELGCQEGKAFDCASVMQRADRDHLTVVPVSCIVAAQSNADVRGCGGFVKCP